MSLHQTAKEAAAPVADSAPRGQGNLPSGSQEEISAIFTGTLKVAGETICEDNGEEERHLHIFDMDGTLTLSPEPNKHRQLTQIGKGWWTDPRSLDPKLPLAPVAQTVSVHKAICQAAGHVAVIMTGRPDTAEMREAVSAALKRIGVEGHEHEINLFLKTEVKTCDGAVQEALDWKKAKLWELIQQHKPSHVSIYDDRREHCLEFAKFLSGRTMSGPPIKLTVYHVRHPDWGSGEKMPKIA